jgi:hypothetical protein
MEPLNVLIVAPSQSSGLFEQVVSHVREDSRIAIAQEEADIGRILLEMPIHCVIVDWDVDFIVPELFPRALGRVQVNTPCFTVAIVHQPDQLHTALTSGYDFAFRLEFSRVLYYTIRSILQILHKNVELAGQLAATQQECQRLATRADHFLQIIERMQARRLPEYLAVSRFATDAGLWILHQAQLSLNGYFTDPKQFELAARLYAIARILLDSEYLLAPVHQEGVPTSAVSASIPTIAAELLEHLVEYPETRLLLLTMYENYDGTGFPNRSQGWHIPLGARILRVVVDFAELVFRDGLSMLDALSRIEQQSRRIYDQRIVVLLGEYVSHQHQQEHDQLISLRIENLAPGMRLGSDIITTAGHKLAARGTELTPQYIERIRAHHATDPVIGKVYVYRD